MIEAGIFFNRDFKIKLLPGRHRILERIQIGLVRIPRQVFHSLKSKTIGMLTWPVAWIAPERYKGWHELGYWRGRYRAEKGELANHHYAYFYTTFFTSVWLWLYVSSTALIRMASRSDPLLRFLRYILPIEDKPLRAIGIVAFVPGILVSGLLSLLARIL